MLQCRLITELQVLRALKVIKLSNNLKINQKDREVKDLTVLWPSGVKLTIQKLGCQRLRQEPQALKVLSVNKIQPELLT